MGYVSSETIDAVIERLNGLREREVIALQRRLGPAQPELAAFVLAYTHDRGPDVSGFAIATTMVLLEAFRASGLKMRKARERVVARQWEASRALLAALREDVEENGERAAGTTMTASPRRWRTSSRRSRTRRWRIRSNSSPTTSGISSSCSRPSSRPSTR